MKEIIAKKNKIGFISDLHNNIEILEKLIEWFEENPIDAIILGGDIPGYNKTSYKKILKKLLKLNIPLIIFPGSHENVLIYEKVMEEMKETKYKKLIIDASKKNNRLIKYSDWEFVIIPGSKVVSNGPRKYIGGSYWLFEEKITKKMRERAKKRLREIGFSKEESLVSIQDTTKLIEKKSETKGSKKILFAHEPLNCKTKKGLDIAIFGKVKKEFKVLKKHLRLKTFKELGFEGQPELITTNNILPINEARLLKKYNYPITITRKHVGDSAINRFLKKHRITKMVCGHIHECSTRAINLKEEKIKAKNKTSQLLINSGINNATIISFEKKKISYEFWNKNKK